MLRAPVSPPQLQTHQLTDATMTGHPFHNAKDSSNKGTSGAILKATAKVLAFLSRRSQSLQSEQGEQHLSTEVKVPQLQSNGAARRGERQGDLRPPTSLPKGHSSFRQYLSQHRTLAHSHESKLESESSSQTKNRASASSSSSPSVAPDTILSGHDATALPCFNPIPSNALSQINHRNSHGRVSKDTMLKAREHLRLVRHLLKSQPKHSAFFQQYAPLVDDWRNFLPGGAATVAASNLLIADGQTAQLGKVAREASALLLPQHPASHHSRPTISTSSSSTSQGDNFEDALDHGATVTRSTTAQTMFASASESERLVESQESHGSSPDQTSCQLTSPRQQRLRRSTSPQSVGQDMRRERDIHRFASAASLSSSSSSLLSRPGGSRLNLSFLSANDADDEDGAEYSGVTSPLSPTSTMPSLMAALTDRDWSSTHFTATTPVTSSALDAMASPLDRSNDGDDESDGYSLSDGKGGPHKRSTSARVATARHYHPIPEQEGELASSPSSPTQGSGANYFQEAQESRLSLYPPRSEFILGSEQDSDYNSDDSQYPLLPSSARGDTLVEPAASALEAPEPTTAATTTVLCVGEDSAQMRVASPDSIHSNTGSTSDASTLINSDAHLPAMAQPPPIGHQQMSTSTVETTVPAPTTVRPSLTLQTLNHSQQRTAADSQGPLTAYESQRRATRPSLIKCNSTSSLYIDSTMTKNDVDETLRAVASVLYSKVLQSHKLNDCRTEPIINSTSYMHTERVLMTEADIFDFMRFIFDCGQNLGAENAIITLVYLERALDKGHLSFHAINWRRLLLGALILSIKVWEDMAVFNADVCSIFDGLHVQDVNALERFMMARMDYNMSVKRSVYAAAYFQLRDISETHSNRIYMQLAKESSSTSPLDNGSATTPTCSSLSSATAPFMTAFPLPAVPGTTGSLSRKAGATTATTLGTVPIGPGYRKWTLKPLTVREADRLEARSELFSCKLMMEEQDRKDMGCCLDEYAAMMHLATPEDLYHSMHTIASTVGSSSSASASTTSTSASSTMAPMTTTTTTTKDGSDSSMSQIEMTQKTTAAVSSPKLGGLNAAIEQGLDHHPPIVTMPPRTLRMKKSRSDFFYQNTTPAAIM